MTLNITVVSPDAIYQCCDFRLSDFKLAADGSFVPIQDNSPKLITLSYEGWAGYLAYCGIGKWAGKPTYAYAADWVIALGHTASFDEVVGVLERQGSSWINNIQRQLGKFAEHTFVCGAFVDRRPRLALISNASTVSGSIPKVAGTDVPPLSVAQGFRVFRHCNGPMGQLLCVLGGR